MYKSQEFLDRVEVVLSGDAQVTFIQEPLQEVASRMSQQLDLPIIIDERSLDEIGLPIDEPMSADFGTLPAYDLFSLLLQRYDITLTVRHKVVVITTMEAAEDSLLTRIYWLEGMGINGDFDSLMSMIEATIAPDLWEALGGSSTMVPASGSRPGLVVSTTYEMHREIEQLLQTLRENSFRLDGVSEEIEVAVPVATPPAGGGGFM